MTRTHDPAVRCPRCRVHLPLCFCDQLPRIETATRLVLVVHRAEVRKSTNTGLLAASCLPSSLVVERGHEGQPSEPLPLPAGATPLLLFPAEDACLLPDALPPPGHPVALVVPDGTWRQASRVRRRVPGLDAVRCVALPPGPPSRYRLRTGSHPAALSTIEAIARALECTEGPAVRAALERVFRLLVERSLWAKGLLPRELVTDGIPCAGTAVAGPPAARSGLSGSSLHRQIKNRL